MENGNERKDERGDEWTRDGSLDRLGRPAHRGKTGGWESGMFLLVNQGLAILAFVGVEVNLVLFSTRVLKQTNAEASNTFSKWMGTVHLFSLVGAFISDSYWGRYKTCAVFQVVFTVGLAMLSMSAYYYLLKPDGCGKIGFQCNSHSSLEVAVFYISIYLIALGQGAYEPALTAFGSDQFDKEDTSEKCSKVSFFSYFYVAVNLGSLFSETVLAYFENLGYWTLGFLVSTFGCLFALSLFLGGSLKYRHFKPCGNPLSRFCQVIVVAVKKSKVKVPSDGYGLYELDGRANSSLAGRKIQHSEDFKFLDRAAIITNEDKLFLQSTHNQIQNPWHLCTITQVEEVKCVLRLLPVWFCTILYYVVFIQMTSLFLEQGATMDTSIAKFHIPPASMSIFDIISTSLFIVFYDRIIIPCYTKLIKNKPKVLTELQRMGIGLAIAISAIVTAAIVEQYRLRHAIGSDSEFSSVSIFWLVPQYVLLGVSEAFMYVGQMGFFTAQTPDGLQSLGIGLCMASNAIGSYLCSFILTVVMEITTRGGHPGWIPPNLNKGHMDRFLFLLAALTMVNLGLYAFFMRRYKYISLEERSEGIEKDEIEP